MAINYDEINDNLLRVIQNADNQGEFLQDFLGAPSGDVTFQNVAPDGSLITRTIPNLAKFTGSVTGTIASSMRMTLYVDATVGDDGNTGTVDNPLKSIKRAIDLAPSGSYLTINLTGDAYHVIDAGIFLAAKNVLIVGTGDTKAIVAFSTYANDSYPDNCFYFRLESAPGSLLSFDNVEFKQYDRVTDGDFNSSLYGGAPIMLNGGNFSANGCSFDLNEIETDLTMITRYRGAPSITLTYAEITTGDYYVVNNRNSCAFLLSATTNTVDDETKYVRNIARDANGSVINVTTNIAL
jgi:hypothetical protein